MATTVSPSKTVFTADVVEFNFLPEKYTKAVSRIIAELRVHIETDWQASVNKWYRGLDVVTDTQAVPPTSASKQLTNAVYRERIGQVLTCAQQELIVRGTNKVISDLSLPAMFNHDGAQALVSESAVIAGNSNVSATIRETMAKQIARGILYQIAKDAGYYTGTGETFGLAVGSGGTDGTPTSPGTGTTIAAQFQSVLQAILSNSTTSTQNNLIISLDKVEADLGGDAKSLVDYHAITGSNASSEILSAVKVTQETPVSKLQHLLSASAFAPVINRWVSGGNFSRNVVDGTIQSGALTSITIADFVTKNKGTKGALENGAYSGVEGTAAQVASEGGPGTDATFNLTVGSTNAGVRTLTAAVSAGGSGYAVNNTITINNNAWGGSTPADADTGSAEILKYTGTTQLVLTVSAVGAGGAVTEVTTNFADLPAAIAEMPAKELDLNGGTGGTGANAKAKATVAITSDPATGVRVMTASLTASGSGYDTTNLTVDLDNTAAPTGTVTVAFTVTVDEGDTGFHFDLNKDTANNTNNIHKNSELVFPVKIVVADAGMVPEGSDMGQAVTLSGSNEVADTAINAMEFQLNIILSDTKEETTA